MRSLLIAITLFAMNLSFSYAEMANYDELARFNEQSDIFCKSLDMGMSKQVCINALMIGVSRDEIKDCAENPGFSLHPTSDCIMRKERRLLNTDASSFCEEDFGLSEQPCFLALNYGVSKDLLIECRDTHYLSAFNLSKCIFNHQHQVTMNEIRSYNQRKISTGNVETEESSSLK